MLSLEYMDSVKQWADAKGLPIHLDGARIFNAAAYLGGCWPLLGLECGPEWHHCNAAACLGGCRLATPLAVAQTWDGAASLMLQPAQVCDLCAASPPAFLQVCLSRRLLPG